MTHLPDRCPNCDQDKLIVKEAIVDTLVPEGSYWLVECENCGHMEERDDLVNG